ncbi:hypothetical protein CDAR_511561 [Caerostris darwini]|uniref:Uncharacterized protein n=1 Tax=Caerostris darwini TaxID=1538125 RepID=A0AAV4TQU8_9ARAC|nr:hypothetical protein CDAR_511561 [Caerostris darwini]
MESETALVPPHPDQSARYREEVLIFFTEKIEQTASIHIYLEEPASRSSKRRNPLTEMLDSRTRNDLLTVQLLSPVINVMLLSPTRDAISCYEAVDHF